MMHNDAMCPPRTKIVLSDEKQEIIRKDFVSVVSELAHTGLAPEAWTAERVALLYIF